MADLHGIIGDFLEGNIKTLGGTPVIEPKTIIENGIYNAPEGVDGYNPITVNVPSAPPVVEELTATENGTYTPEEGVDGFNPVTVNVPTLLLEDRYINANGQYGPTEGYDGIRRLTVEVPVPSIVPLTINANGVYESTGGTGYNPITVNVPQNCEMYSANDDKLRLYENVFNGLNVLSFNGLYINQTMAFNDVDNTHIKEVLNDLSIVPIARVYNSASGLTPTNEISIDSSASLIRLYSGNLASYDAQNVYGSVVLIQSDLIANQYPIQVCPNIS